MWFKQIQFCQLTGTIPTDPDGLEDVLAAFAFTDCLPSFPSSQGWVNPVFSDHTDTRLLAHVANGKILLCLQFADKLLPTTVVQQALNEKVQALQKAEGRIIRNKEKNNLKEAVTLELLPKAFSKLTRVYAYIDTHKNWLVIGTTNATRTEAFLKLLKKSLSLEISYPTLKNIPKQLTDWVVHDTYPDSLALGKKALLQDPNEQARTIRAQQQDVQAQAMLDLIGDGCEVKQLSLEWHDRLKFTLVDDFSLRSLVYGDEVLELAKEAAGETPEQQFDADFFIMTDTLDKLLDDLLALFKKTDTPAPAPESEKILAPDVLA